MELVEFRAVRVQHQRPPGARHHLAEDHLAQRAAARGEVDVHDRRVEWTRANGAASCTARANTEALVSAEPSSMVGHVPHRDVRR